MRYKFAFDMASQKEIQDLQKQLNILGKKKMELADMCRVDQLAEIKARIQVIRERIQAQEVTPVVTP